VTDYHRLLAELAAPRLTGSPRHARTREALRAELERRGYVVLEHAFPVRLPGRLAGARYAAGALLWASASAALARGVPALGGVSVALAALLVLGVALLGRRARPESLVGVNLIGVRPRARVTVWVAAHYDSKGQPLSMLWRLAGAVTAVVGTVTLGVVVAAWVSGVRWSRPTELFLLVPGVVGGLALLQNRATNSSPGAVDNASALVTALAVLDRLPATAAVGVLFPDAEEYGLLGARALARERANLFAGTALLNLDGIDDRGPTLCVVHRGGPLVDAVAAALGARRRRWMPVVVDGSAFAPVTRECATIMRGDWRTAAVVHTARDTVDRLTLSGCDRVATGLAQALEGLLPA